MKFLSAVLATMLLFVASCGDAVEEEPEDTTGTAVTTPVGDAQTVNVELDEWAVRVDDAEVEAGNIRFTAKNLGSVPHQLVVVRTDDDVGALPVLNTMVDEARVDTVAEMDAFQPDRERQMTADLTPGPYILFCNQPAHYTSGMRTRFTVR